MRFWAVAMVVVVVLLLATHNLWLGLLADTIRPEYLAGELDELAQELLVLRENLRKALAPAFMPMAHRFIEQKYRHNPLRTRIHTITVEPDGSFGVIIEVFGTDLKVYVQEHFRFRWQEDTWVMQYVEADV